MWAMVKKRKKERQIPDSNRGCSEDPNSSEPRVITATLIRQLTDTPRKVLHQDLTEKPNLGFEQSVTVLREP